MNNFIDWVSLPFKKQTGKEKLRCPSCDDVRSDKRDKSLQINHDDGYGKCHYCEALTFKEELEYGKTNKVYTEIKEEPVTKDYSEGFLKWIENERGLSEETLRAMYVTEEMHYQPKRAKEVNNVVFNYYEGSKLVNKKFRSGGKDFTSVSGGKPILYNINSAIGVDELWIVEGEFDALVLKQKGIKNVVSLPNGANDSDEYWSNSEKYIKHINSFIIAVDNDEKGHEIRERIAQRLGRYRCKYIEWNNKDANDDLLDGSIENSLRTAKKFPVGGTHSVEDLYDSLLGLYENGLPKTISPKKECFGNLPDIFTIMRGHLVTGTGIPSHGKSSYTDWYILNLIQEYDMKASLFSPEHSPMELHLSKYASLAVGKPFFKNQSRLSKADLKRFKDWSNEKLYFTSSEDGDFPTWSWIFEKFKEQVFAYGIDIFVIDAFNKVVMDKGQEGKAGIDAVLTKLTMFAQIHNVIIFLIAHPTKMKKSDDGLYEIPTLYDVSGSADFRNQTHDGFTIYRYFETEERSGYNIFVNQKTKFDFQGKIGGQVEFEYDLDTGRYFAVGHPKYFDDMTIPKEEKQEELSLEPTYSQPISKVHNDFTGEHPFGDVEEDDDIF